MAGKVSEGIQVENERVGRVEVIHEISGKVKVKVSG